MTRKHFQEIARILNEFRSYPDTDKLVRDFARFCKNQNERFDRDRFIRAVEGK